MTDRLTQLAVATTILLLMMMRQVVYYVGSEAPAFIQQLPRWRLSVVEDLGKFRKSFIIFQTFYGNYRHAMYVCCSSQSSSSSSLHYTTLDPIYKQKNRDTAGYVLSTAAIPE